MSIPTGADYHILKAKSHANDAAAMPDCAFKTYHLTDAVREIVKALELMQRERERKEQ